MNDVFEEVLQLPVQERLELLLQLLQSLNLPVPPDEDVPAGVRAAWKEDILRRLDEIRSGQLRPV